MNTQNVGSFEACKRLVEAGIVLETESCWRYGLDDKWSLVSVDWATTMMSNTLKVIPAPSMVEAWRELPFQSYIKKLDDGSTLVWTCNDDVDGKYIESNMTVNINPTDALIDLLIWVRKEKP